MDEIKDRIIEDLKKLLRSKGYEPNEVDDEEISFLYDYHECEPSALAERLAEKLGLEYQEVYNLL